MSDPSRVVWTDEFNPAGEELPEAVIQMRRLQRPPPQRPPGPPLGLDLANPPPMSPPDQWSPPPHREDSWPQDEDMIRTALFQLLQRGGGQA
jgi:hypothetical protein